MTGYSMKKQVFYIHGGDSYTKYEDFLHDLSAKTIRDPFGLERKVIWTEKLRETLGAEFEVLMPTMPNKQNAKYEEWKIWFERHFAYLRDGVILVGWSLGGMFLAKYLTENKFPVTIKSVYLLGSPSGEFVGDCGDFSFSMENSVNLTENLEKINVWHSEDDFVVPYQEFNLYKKHWKSANFVSFTDKNHFLVEELPELIDAIKKT